MVIQVRGTNGSGKSYLVRRVAGLMGPPMKLHWQDLPKFNDKQKHFVLLTGGNCCGKSTIFNLLCKTFPMKGHFNFVSADNDPHWKADVNELRRRIKKWLSTDSSTYLMEGTRITQAVFQTLGEMKDKTIKVTVVVIEQPLWLAKLRITKRRDRAGRALDKGLLTNENQLKYNACGVRQVNALAKYGKLYEHDVHVIESKPNFINHPEIIGAVLKGLGCKTAIEAYELKRLFVLGDYGNECGGCDKTFKTQDHLCEVIAKYAVRGKHVLMEQLIASHLYGRYAELYHRLKDKMIFAFLDTPVELCAERTKRRRRLRGNNKPFDNKNLLSHYKSSFTCKKKFDENGVKTMILHYTEADKQLMGMLR